MKKQFYKKWWFWLVSAVIIVAAISGGMAEISESGNVSVYEPESLENEWIITPNGKSVQSSYPDVMNLSSDGTGIADGKNLTWSAEDGVLHLYIGSADLDYNYHFSDNKLYLNDYEYTRPDYTLTPASNFKGSVWKPEYAQTLVSGKFVDNPTFTISDIADDGSYISIVDENGNTYTANGSDSNNENIIYNGSADFEFDNDVPFDQIAFMGINERSNQPLRIFAKYSWNGIGDSVDYYLAN